MSGLQDFKVNEQRDATDSIRGYVYQIYQSVLAWIELKDNEILVLEGAEDFDVHCDSSVQPTQVKNISGNLTLRSGEVVKTMNNFWDHKERNLKYDIVYRFLTTAEAGLEHGSPFGNGQKGLELWQRAASSNIDIGLIKAFLLKTNLNQRLKAFIQRASDDELREQLISRIKWDMGNKEREAIQYLIEDKLKLHGFRQDINSISSCKVMPHLLKNVADLLSKKGTKELRFSDFLTCFDKATTVSIPRAKYEALVRDSEIGKEAAGHKSAEILRNSDMSFVVGNPMPLVVGGIHRAAIIQNLIKVLDEQHVLFLYGSSGVGKTNLVSNICINTSAEWRWVTFRGMPAVQIKDILSRIFFQVNNYCLPPYLVLDDIDLSQTHVFERELVSLVFSITNINGMIIVTGLRRPPIQLLIKLWKDNECEFNVPYFSEAEVKEMVRINGLSNETRASSWARAIWLTTSGHPQLVHARVRTLSAKKWPPVDLIEISKPEDVERVREEARTRLVREFPDDDTRLLAYRLSVINGAFNRETAIAVGKTHPPIKLPGEAFDTLIGPWIERDREDRFRISPLLAGAADNALSKEDVKLIHGAIALSIISRKNIDQFEVSAALFHAYMAKDTYSLARLANVIVTTKTSDLNRLYGALSWFTLLSLRADERILPEDPCVDSMLRLVQYRLVTCTSSANNVVNIIEHIERALGEIEPLELKAYSEMFTYGFILNEPRVHIPPSVVIRILSRMIDLEKQGIFEKDHANIFGDSFESLVRLGDNRPSQILFSYQHMRLRGFNDLLELIKALDTLSSHKREHLLSVLNSEEDFASTLINNVWWQEAKDGTLDIETAQHVLDFTATKSREWKEPNLTKACLVAASIIYDEYGGSTKSALEILDVADAEFPDEAILVNQRAKVLFNAGSKESLSVAKRALSLRGLSKIEYVFCCRLAGIAAADSRDWAEAERLFLQGAEGAKKSSIQEGMGIGLMADAAFALWKQGRWGDSLLLFADAIDHLETIPVTEDIRFRYLHLSIRYCISWIHFQARGKHYNYAEEPRPGVCSNQEPPEGARDHQLVDIHVVWELLALTERILDLSVGIEERARSTTESKKSLLMVRYKRAVVFDSVFKSKNFDGLIPAIIGMIESLDHSEKLNKGEDLWANREIPKHSSEYLLNSEYCYLLYHYILAAYIVSIASGKSGPQLVDRWRTDLSSVGVLSRDIDQFLDVLLGTSPNESLYQQAAASIFTLNSGSITPAKLWISTFRLLRAFANDCSMVEAELEKILVAKWLFAVSKQRFAFVSPSLSCSEIEKRCQDQSISGIIKIASILDASAPYLSIHLPIEAKQMLRDLINDKRS